MSGKINTASRTWKTRKENAGRIQAFLSPPRLDFIILRVYLAFHCQETACTMEPELDCSCTMKMHHCAHSSSPRSTFLVSFFSFSRPPSNDIFRISARIPRPCVVFTWQREKSHACNFRNFNLRYHFLAYKKKRNIYVCSRINVHN